MSEELLIQFEWYFTAHCKGPLRYEEQEPYEDLSHGFYIGMIKSTNEDVADFYLKAPLSQETIDRVLLLCEIEVAKEKDGESTGGAA